MTWALLVPTAELVLVSSWLVDAHGRVARTGQRAGKPWRHGGGDSGRPAARR